MAIGCAFCDKLAGSSRWGKSIAGCVLIGSGLQYFWSGAKVVSRDG